MLTVCGASPCVLCGELLFEFVLQGGHFFLKRWQVIAISGQALYPLLCPGSKTVVPKSKANIAFCNLHQFLHFLDVFGEMLLYDGTYFIPLFLSGPVFSDSGVLGCFEGIVFGVEVFYFAVQQTGNGVEVAELGIVLSVHRINPCP